MKIPYLKTKSCKIFFLVLTFLLTISTDVIVFAKEVDVSQVNADKFGFLTIIPPLIAIILAFITKNVIISLFVGTISGCIMLQLSGVNIISAMVTGFLDFIQRALNSISDPWNAGIVMQVLAIGGVISLVAKMGGAKAIAEALVKRAKTPRSAQITAWLLGILVFFDDYANSLIVGPIMRPVADKLKISREKLAFIIDATAAPIAGLAIISTWIGLEVGLIGDAFSNGIGKEVDAFGVFLQTIPYRFYNILILGFVLLTAITLREFGPMRKVEIKSRNSIKNNKKINNLIEKENSDLQPKEGVKLSVWNAIIPIGSLILSALVGFYHNGWTIIMQSNEASVISSVTKSPFSFYAIRETFSRADASTVLFQAALIASIIAILMAVIKKIYSFSQAIEVWIDGMKGLLLTGVILVLAWSLSSVIKDLGTAKYLVSILSNAIPKVLLPSIIFILGSIMSFATGTAYGTMGILMPLAIPLASSISPEMGYIVLSTSAVLTGAIFGDHCSPISDTTILSSMGAGCNHIEHVRTQISYSVFVAVITIFFGYIPAAMGLSIFIVLPMSFLAMIIIFYLISKPIKNANSDIASKYKDDAI